MAKFLRKEVKKKSHFLRNMVIYVILMSALIGVGLYYFWYFIAAYEASLPAGTLAAYEEGRMQKDFQEYLANYAENHTTPFQTQDEMYAYIMNQLDLSAMKLRKDAAASTDETPVYAVRVDKERVGSVSLNRVALGGKSFGMRGYAVGQISYDYNPIASSTYSVTVPKDAYVSVNGIRLSAENSAVQNVPSKYVMLTEEYQQFEDVKYTFSYVGTPNLVVSGRSDCTYEMTETVPGEFFVQEHGNLSNYEGIEQEAKNFVQDYVVYLSGSGSYGQVLTHLLPDTSFRERVVSTIGGSLWAKGVTYGIQNFELESVTPWGEGTIVTCHYQISYQDGDVFNGNMYILFVRRDNAWRVFNIEMF